MLWMGEEIGMTGDWGEDGRKPMPWHRPETWNTELLEWYRDLGALRAAHDALRHGGLRWVYVSADVCQHVRESPSERLLVVAARADHDDVAMSRAGLGVSTGTRLEPLLGTSDAITASDDVVRIPGGSAGLTVWRLDSEFS